MKASTFQVAATASVLALAACACQPYPGPSERGQITTEVGLTVTPTSGGGFDFRYSGQFADAHGNFNFAQRGAYGNAVTIVFTIDPASAPGLKFKPYGADAMWIVEKKVVGEGSPEGPYRGDQYYGFSTSADGRTLRVMNRNDDGVLYRYALRFDLNGQTVQHDPDSQNGAGGGGGH